MTPEVAIAIKISVVALAVSIISPHFLARIRAQPK